MKTKRPTFENIEDYITSFPSNVRRGLQSIRKVIRKAAPDAVEAMKYQIPTFVLHDNLVHFAAYKDHIGFYPTPSGIEQFKDDLSTYPFAKGSVRFPLDKPIPLDLIRRIVEFRVMESRAKSIAKPRKKTGKSS